LEHLMLTDQKLLSVINNKLVSKLTLLKNF
jgi:hypothetical protein